MKKLMLFLLFLSLLKNINAQSAAETVIAGGKAMIELITVLQKNKPASGANLKEKITVADSCMLKQKSDLCFRNSGSRDLLISIYKRNDTTYEPTAFTVKVITKKKECLYELRSGIYKYRVEYDDGVAKILVSEGEFRLLPCDSMLREIRE